MEARADRKGCLLHNPHAAYAVSGSLSQSDLSLSTAQVMFATRNPLHVIGIPLSASDGSCSRHPNDGDARAHHKECTLYLSMFEFHCPRLTALDIQTTEARAHLKDCCTPRSPRVHVKSIARINGCMSA